MDSSPAPNPHRVRRFLPIAVGWLLIALFVLVMVTAPTTKAPERLYCGKPAIVLMFVKNAADVPASRLEACHHEAGSQVLGSLFIFGLPGAVLLLWKRLHWRLPSRAVRPPRRPSRFGPAPIEMMLTSHLDRDTAAERLRALGNGGPRGSLRVRFGQSEFVDARLVLQSSPRFFGTLTSTPDG